MQDFIYDNLDRSQLQPLEGEFVAFTGKVQQVVSPSKDKKYVCLQNVKLARIDNHTRFADREQFYTHHMWLDVSDVSHIKHQMYLEMIGCGTLVKYKRKDGTESFGLKFTKPGLTEVSFRQKMVQTLEMINRSDMTIDAKAKAVKKVVKMFTDYLNDETVVLFESTVEEELKTIASLQGRFMQCAGVYTPLNREGRRATRIGRHRPKPQSKAKGFC